MYNFVLLHIYTYNIIVYIYKIVSLHDIHIQIPGHRKILESVHKKNCLKKLEKSIKTDIH